MKDEESEAALHPSAMTIPEAFQIAVQRHRAGRLAEAEALYRQILAAQPNHADAAHSLGVIALQVGRHDAAIEWMRKAIALDPNHGDAQLNLGAAYRVSGRLDEAIAAGRRAVELQPGHPEAHNNLGAALAMRGQIEEAVSAFRRAVELMPGHVEAHYNLGNALTERGLFEEAIAAYRRAVELKPDHAEAHQNLGLALKSLGRFDEAIAALRRALELQPGHAEARHALGLALHERGQLDEAAAAFQRALQIQPDHPEAWSNLGAALAAQGRMEEAIMACRRALEIRPDSPRAYNNLGCALREVGRLRESVEACRRALELQADFAEAHNNLGAALVEQNHFEEGLAACARALELQPDFAEAHNNLGNALKGQGRLNEAIAAYRRALEIEPGCAWMHSNLICTLHFHPGQNERKITAERRRWNIRFGDPLKPSIQRRPHDPNPHRRLRIGYVSPDFRGHVVGRLFLPLFERHDREQFELLCYSGGARADSMTERFRALSGEWRDTVGVSDGRLAEMIREDRVDILVDLTQHLARNRLLVFARKPAPIQVSFAGYPESTGLEAIEYRISDRYLEGASADERTERQEQVSLIDSFYCYHPFDIQAEVNPLPALENGTVTLGCLNNFCKVNERVLTLWARVLRRVGNARLLISSAAGSHRQRTLETLAREGVEAHRVEFVEPRPLREYFGLYHRLDLAVDTFPYNGGITTCDALWMGVPVVSLAGETPVSRAGLSILTNLGLPELAAHSETEYVNLVESLASDLPRLARLRLTLRERMENSVLMDAPRLTRQIEEAYRMWERMKDEG